MAIGGRSNAVFAEINITPPTDVFLVLLVIMIVIAPVANRSVLKVNPPGGHRHLTDNLDTPTIHIDVTGAGIVRVNGSDVFPANTANIQTRILGEITRLHKELPLEVQAESAAQQQHVVAVLDAAAGANIKQLRILPLKD